MSLHSFLTRLIWLLAETPATGAPPPDITEIATARRLLDEAAEKRATAEAARRESEQRFRATFEQAAVGIALVAPDGRWGQVNHRLCEIVGYSQDELLARTFQDITHPDDLDTDIASMRQMLAGEIETYSMEKRYLHKGGAIVWINLTVALVRRPDGSPDYFISVVEDIQRRKEAEAAFTEAAAKIQKGDFDAAIALLRGLLEKDPDDGNALFFLGLSYVKKKMYQDALDPLTRVTELTPGFPRAYFELGVCYRQLGDRKKALAAFEKNLELDPANTDSAYNAGLILFETNRIDEALVRFESGLLSRPEDPDLLTMAGRCDINQGKFKTAVERLEKARAATTDPDKSAFLDELIGRVKGLVP